MKILCTFPGKFGDLLWALPTIRAISRRVGEPVDLLVAKPFDSITPLLRHQPYLRKVWADPRWEVLDTAPISPRVPQLTWDTSDTPDHDPWAASYDAILHLGYRDWPTPDVAIHTRLTATIEGRTEGVLEYPLDLAEWSFDPWITLPPEASSVVDHWTWPWVYGFTDEHFELKVGLVTLLEEKPYWWKQDKTLHPTTIGANPRWQTEAGYFPTSWLDSAQMLQHTRAFLGDCSALHVLAVAMGVPAVLMEPNPMRHNQVFYPLGTEGPRVKLVRGIDGNPTFDARHVKDALANALAARVDSATP